MVARRITRLNAVALGFALMALPLATPTAFAQDLQPEPDAAAGNIDTDASKQGKPAPEDTAGKAPDGDPKKPYADEAVKHYNRGVELHQSGFLNQAITEYKAALEADSRMEESYSNLGLIYAAQRNYPKAIDAFKKALSLKPGRPTTLNGLGTVLYAKGKVSDAMEKWRQAVVSDPQFASAYYNMGNALENERDVKGGVEAYVKAIRINPGMADAYYRVGTIFNRDRHPAQAFVLLTRAVALAPDADFARDAKRQISTLESQFTREDGEEPEVKMNIMAPPSSGTAGEPQAGQPAETSSQQGDNQKSGSGTR